MRPARSLLAAALFLSACAAQGDGPLPVCDGKLRRTANPYGSVLGDPARPAPTTPPAPQEARPCGDGR